MTHLATLKGMLSLRNAAFSAAFLTVAAVNIPGSQAHAQANVVENEPATLYVDGFLGADSNPGSQALPFRTVSAGVLQAERNNVKGIGTKVLVNPGVYREYVEITSMSNMTSAPITVQASILGTAAIAGSDVFTNFYQGTGNSAIYSHAWNYTVGSCPIPSGWPATMQPILLRREMVYINHIPLTQVMALSQMIPGTFFVDDVSRQLQIWPTAGTNMNTALVEVAARPNTLNVKSRSNLVIRGLVLEHGATCVNDNGANVYNGSNVLIDGVQANWNNWGGLEVHSTTNVTVQNSVSSHNGAVGFGAFRGKQVLFQFDESDYNNWRGAQAAFYDFGQGGTKFFNVHGAAVNQLFAYNNQAQGLWFDTDNRQIAVQNAILSGNQVDNLQLELNVGPISVSNSTVCYGQVGSYITNASNLTLTNNVYYNNGGSKLHTMPQLYLAGKPGGRSFTDWETGVYYNVISSNLTLNGNIFEDGDVNQEVFGTYQTGADWAAFASTFSSNNNHWYDSTKTTAFTTSAGRLGFAAWQSYTHQDSTSTWGHTTNVAQNCTAPPTDYPDFAMYADSASYNTTNKQAVVSLLLKPFVSGPGSTPLTKTPRLGSLHPAITSGNASTAPVILSAPGLPSGYSALFGANTITSTGLTTTLTITAPLNTAPQTLPVTIFAQNGTQVHTITVMVNVS